MLRRGPWRGDSTQDLFKCQNPQFKSINRENWLCSGEGVSCAPFQSWEFVPRDFWNPKSFLPSRNGAGEAGGAFSATTGGFPCGCLVFLLCQFPRRDHRGVQGLKWSSKFPVPVDSSWSWCILDSGQLRAFPV